MTDTTIAGDLLRILLIEDSKGDAILIQRELSLVMTEEYEVLHAATLSEAIAVLSEQSVDIALLDRSLPDTEGFIGLHNMQMMFPNLPIIFLTAYKDETTAFEAIEQGAQDYLLKDEMNGRTIKRAIQFAILRKQFEGVLMTRANFDMLTGLANRMLFESRLDMSLARMLRHNGNVAVLFIDLDKFKPINDTYGHAAGDDILKEVGLRLKRSLRPYDTAARFGGDEFAILLERLPDPKHSMVVAQKIISMFEAPFTIEGHELPINISIGISQCNSDQIDTVETLLQKADSAMYEAKTNPESNFHIYS